MQNIHSIIAGKPVASPLAPFDKIYPATGEVIAQIEPATNEMLDMAVQQASSAQQEWAARPAFERARILNNIARLMAENN